MSKKPPLVAVSLSKWPNGVWKLTIICPYCNKKHHHGGGRGPTPHMGHRHAHCTHDRSGMRPDCSAGYTIVTEAEVLRSVLG